MFSCIETQGLYDIWWADEERGLCALPEERKKIEK